MAIFNLSFLISIVSLGGAEIKILWHVLWAKNHLQNLIEIKQFDSKN